MGAGPQAISAAAIDCRHCTIGKPVTGLLKAGMRVPRGDPMQTVRRSGPPQVAEARQSFDLTPSEFEGWIEDAKRGMESALRAHPLDIREQCEMQPKDLHEAQGVTFFWRRALRDFYPTEPTDLARVTTRFDSRQPMERGWADAVGAAGWGASTASGHNAPHGNLVQRRRDGRAPLCVFIGG